MRSVLRTIASIALLACVLPVASANAQVDGGAAPPPNPATLVKATAEPVTITAGGKAVAVVHLAIQPKWHINANPPSPDYMIPTVVTVTPAGGLTGGKAVYPAPTQLKVEFDPAPLSVYTDSATIGVPLAAAATAAGGAVSLRGNLRYQACNDQVCTAPTTIPFTIAVTVAGAPPGSAPVATATPDTTTAAATPDTAAVQSSGGGTGASPLTLPPGVSTESGAAGAAGGTWLDRALESIRQGGLGAIVFLFLLGLALNLTPCVYPMLGVTLSIFGARGPSSTGKVLGAAVVYVLGIAAMYSALGTIAALTGGLFGAFLQNPLVLVAIGVLFLALSLSMFGVYELNPPPWLLQRLGGSGTTGAIGLFLSGLVVGVFAAPCTGPPVIALLALVAKKADAWYGFRTFFAFSLGLGAPYLVLAMFSNLLQKLPRSGDWMNWVKHLFGVAMLAFGLFYVLNGLAPRATGWILPAALLLGGLWLGLIDKSGEKRRKPAPPVAPAPGATGAATATLAAPARTAPSTFAIFKRTLGVASIAAGAWLVLAPHKQAIDFRPYDEAAVQQALASGKPVILDFGASWCIPCHELDDKTFSDPRVIAAAGSFAAFKVDLTHADSPETIEHTKKFKIAGVPTVVFLTPGGEVESARFSGFLPPEQFLEKMRVAAATAKRG